MVRNLLHVLIRILFTSLARLCIIGLENLPETGPALLAVNHLSRLDSPLIFSVIDRRDITGLVADKYKKAPFIPWLVKVVDGIWVNRESTDFHALRSAVEYLQNGGLLGIAPEGTRSKTGGLIHAKTGVAYIAEKAHVPVIPIAVWGTESAFVQLFHFRRPEINVHIGEPFRLPRLEGGRRSLDLQRNSDEIMCRIALLLPPAYRGVYADHPRLNAFDHTLTPNTARV